MSKRAVLEVIALDVEDAVAAQAGGADRLELVADMAADGLTPPVETFAGIRAAVDIALRVMLRLADGFAAGDVDAVAALVGRGELRAAGADEFVLGFLDEDGGADLDAVERVVAELDGLPLDLPPRDRPRRRPRRPAQAARGPAGAGHLPHGRARPPASTTACPTLLAEAARRGEPGYSSGSWSAAGCVSTMSRGCAPPASTPSTSAARPARPGWAGPVSAEAVREWRTAIDA